MTRDYLGTAISFLEAAGQIAGTLRQLREPGSLALPPMRAANGGSADANRILAATVWGEAGHEATRVKCAIAAVVMNRVNNPGTWGSDVISVCLSPGQFPCWWGPMAPRVRAIDERDVVYYLCTGLAERVLAGAYRDTTGGADHYHREGVCVPYWADGREPTATIGPFVFYRLEGPAADLDLPAARSGSGAAVNLPG